MTLDERIDAIESAYEFMLAYAAQGRVTDQGPGAASELRDYLRRMETGLDGLGEAIADRIYAVASESKAHVEPFIGAAREDATRALAIVRLVLTRQAISSQLIDNVNASVHLRALLTDLFIVDETIKDRP